MTQRLNYTTIAPAGVKALGGIYSYIVQSGLPGPLVNLVYLRVSQINVGDRISGSAGGGKGGLRCARLCPRTTTFPSSP